MEPLAHAARSAASPSLAGVPLVDHVSHAVLSSAKASLLKGLSDAICAGIGLPATLAAAAAAHAGFLEARAKEWACAADAAEHNAFDACSAAAADDGTALAGAVSDGAAGEGIEGYEGPRLIPLHTSELSYLVNRLRSDRCDAEESHALFLCALPLSFAPLLRRQINSFAIPPRLTPPHR